jgi:hypothetical protein
VRKQQQPPPVLKICSSLRWVASRVLRQISLLRVRLVASCALHRISVLRALGDWLSRFWSKFPPRARRSWSASLVGRFLVFVSGTAASSLSCFVIFPAAWSAPGTVPRSPAVFYLLRSSSSLVRAARTQSRSIESPVLALVRTAQGRARVRCGRRPVLLFGSSRFRWAAESRSGRSRFRLPGRDFVFPAAWAFSALAPVACCCGSTFVWGSISAPKLRSCCCVASTVLPIVQRLDFTSLFRLSRS